MKYLKYLLIGIFFGIIMYKSQAVSWYRIYEMFKFQSFHMYGIIGSAVAVGVLFVQYIKRIKMKDFDGNQIVISDKNYSIPRYIIGGTIFGLGWALAGACPGPIFVLFGAGYIPIVIVIIAAVLGTLMYGVLRDKLPH